MRVQSAIPNLPSGLSGNYCQNISDDSPRKIFPRGHELNWYRPDNEHWSYCAGLYSLGQSNLNIADDRLSMISQRNRAATILVADSGGYQLGKGTFKNYEKIISRDFLRTPAYDEMRQSILTWMEKYADYAPIIDFPVWALDTEEKFILSDYDECLNETKRNIEFFNERYNRNAPVKFLTVIQGRYFGEALNWYNSVKNINNFPYSGWSFAGPVGKDPTITLKMILTMWREGRINANEKWIHILGRGSLSAAFVFNVFQQCIRTHVYRDAVISYDASSSSFSVQYGFINTHAVSNQLGMSMQTVKLTREDHSLSKQLYKKWCVWESPFAKDIDFDEFFVADGKYGLDTKSYAIMAHHNAYIYVKAFEMMNLISNLPDNELSNLVPLHFVNFRRDVRAIFEKFTAKTDIRRLQISPDYSNLIK